MTSLDLTKEQNTHFHPVPTMTGRKKPSLPRNPTENFFMHCILDSIFINCFFMGVKELRLLLVALQSTSLPHPVLCLSSHTCWVLVQGTKAPWLCWPQPIFWSGTKGIVYSPWIFFLDIFLWIKAGLSVRFLNGTHFLLCRRGQRWLIKHCFKLLKIIPNPH